MPYEMDVTPSLEQLLTPDNMSSVLSADSRSSHGRIVQIGVHDYTTTLCSAMQSHRERARYTDACLVVKKKKFYVHRVVVSSFSKFLADSFATTGNSSGIIFINDIEEDIMTFLLDFMYKSMAVIQETRLLEFLTAARKLRIESLHTKGLCSLEQKLRKSSALECRQHDYPSSVTVLTIEDRERNEVENDTSSETQAHKQICNDKTLSLREKLESCGTTVRESGLRGRFLEIPARLFLSNDISITPVKKRDSNPVSDRCSSSASGPTKVHSDISSSIRSQSSVSRFTKTPTKSPHSTKSNSGVSLLDVNLEDKDPVITGTKPRKFTPPMVRRNVTSFRPDPGRNFKGTFSRNLFPYPNIQGRGRGYARDKREPYVYGDGVPGEKQVCRSVISGIQENNRNSCKGGGNKKVTSRGRGQPSSTAQHTDGLSVNSYTESVSQSQNKTVTWDGSEPLEIIDTGIIVTLTNADAGIIEKSLIGGSNSGLHSTLPINNATNLLPQACQPSTSSENMRIEGLETTRNESSVVEEDLPDLTKCNQLKDLPETEGFTVEDKPGQIQSEVEYKKTAENDEDSPVMMIMNTQATEQVEEREQHQLESNSLSQVKSQKKQGAPKRIKIQKCPICHKLYRTKGSLGMHMRTHEKEKPFSCTSCSFRTEVLRKIRAHVSKQHRRKLVDSEIQAVITTCTQGKNDAQKRDQDKTENEKTEEKKKKKKKEEVKIECSVRDN